MAEANLMNGVETGINPYASPKRRINKREAFNHVRSISAFARCREAARSD
jgi:hypothetical protein